MNSDPIRILKRHIKREYFKVLNSNHFPSVIRVQIELEDSFDPLSWLASQREYPKFFWRSEDEGRILAYAGASYISTNSDYASTGAQWETVRGFMQQEPHLRCWLGTAFHPRISGSEWSDFDACSLHVPKIGLERDPIHARWHLVCQLIITSREDVAVDVVLSLLDTILYVEDVSYFSPDILAIKETPSYEQWKEMVHSALQHTADQLISKVVLSRRRHLLLNSPVSPEMILAKLLHQKGTAFLYSPAPLTGFLGVSPELLFHRKRDRLDSMAIAGTRPRGKDHIQDQFFKQDLIISQKDRQEHKQVVDMVLNKLKDLCILAKLYGKMEILDLVNQRHFMQRLRGRLLEGVTDETIRNTLHPTPAVGGVPRDTATDFLQKVEPFDRGWFAGTIGWLSHNEAELAVAIRSCLILKENWYIYAGAGLVQGSTAIDEWEEVDLKMKNIMDIIYAR